MSNAEHEAPTVLLYVEDDELTRQSVGQRLIRRGFRVLLAKSGEKALSLVNNSPAPAAALLDLELPGIDGLETYRRLLDSHPSLPAVVCSANLTASSRRRLESLGVAQDCLLAKPCDFQDILVAIQRVVRRSAEA